MESDPLLSRTIDHFQIIERLGRGGMSTVYRARQLSMDRDVALKIMRAELAEDPQFLARFEREARVIASLEHPRILPVHDYGHAEDTFYLVMRLVEGESLRDRLMRGPLSLQACNHLLDQIASALDYAHSKGVIHRDLKPNNVMLDEMDNAYLMDFGIAKLMATTHQITQSGMVMGTPAYMAPEQWRGEAVNNATDVYALGIMLYEMLTGSQPFEAADTPFTLMYKHLNDQPPSICEAHPEVPAAVESVIRRAMAKRAEDRFPSAGEMAHALSLALEGVDPHITTNPLQIERPEGVPAPGTDAEAAQAARSAPDELEAVPIPDHIAPPADPGKPPLPLPSGPDADDGAIGGTPVPGARKSKAGSDTPLPFELPDSTPPAVRNVMEWTADRLQYISIPGFVAPAVDPEPSHIAKRGVSTPVETGSGEWDTPFEAEAMDVVDYYLEDNEELIGTLHARGTNNWRLWRRLLIAGVLISILGNIFGGILDIWVLGLASTIIWIAAIIEAYRVYKGRTGQYYVGFTDWRVVVLPITSDGRPIPSELTSAPWDLVQRCRLTDEYIWIEGSGADTVYLLGWIPVHGKGGLGRQRRWLLHSPLAAAVRARGFYAKS